MKPTSCTHCKDYSRADLLRQTAATAGGGLPSIEPGMPTPAGTGLSRRSMLLRSAGLALTVLGGQALAPRAFEDGIASAMAAGADDHILVSIYLSGGVDALSLLAPVADGTYLAARPTLKVPGSGDAVNVFTEDPRLEWHPGAAGLRDLHREGKVTVMQGLGWDSSHGSHFVSRHYWETGELQAGGRLGWLGRYLDRVGSMDNPLQGLALEHFLAPSLASARVPVANTFAPNQFRMRLHPVDRRSPAFAGAMEAFRSMSALGSGDDVEMARARVAARDYQTVIDAVQPIAGVNAPFQSTVSYPEESYFADRLALLAEMIDLGLPLKVVAIQADGGFDSHGGQNGSFPQTIKAACDGILAFQRDLEARGLADRVLMHVWSEFGRRVQENGSGTDHGAAGIGFVVGANASGQMVGELPSLTSLDRFGNLRSNVDFRGVYGSLLEQWLETEAEGIVPGVERFARPLLVQA